MGDDHRGPAVSGGVQGLLDMDLRIHVQGGSRFIENENWRVDEKDAGQGDPLSLAFGQFESTLTNDGLVTLR